MPRLKGGGSGVRSILVYCESDLKGGWGLRLNCATFFTEITAQVDQGFLVFTGSGTEKVMMKLAMNFGVFDQKGQPSDQLFKRFAQALQVSVLAIFAISCG